MIDFFAVLGLEPRPVIDATVLSDLFASKSKTAHPDHVAGGDFATLNEAFRTLRDPASRILHLLALTGEAPPPKSASVEVSAYFGRVANGLQRFDRMFQPLSRETSSLLRAVKIREGQSVLSDLDKLAEALTSQKQGLLQAMAQIDARWPSVQPTDREALAQIASDLRFLEKWLAQIGERRLRFQESANC
jgi:DnaJ-domain-containing protein 1